MAGGALSGLPVSWASADQLGQRGGARAAPAAGVEFRAAGRPRGRAGAHQSQAAAAPVMEATRGGRKSAVCRAVGVGLQMRGAAVGDGQGQGREGPSLGQWIS